MLGPPFELSKKFVGPSFRLIDIKTFFIEVFLQAFLCRIGSQFSGS